MKGDTPTPEWYEKRRVDLEGSLLRAENEQKFDYYNSLRFWMGESEGYRTWTGIITAVAESDLGSAAHLKHIIQKIHHWPLEVNSTRHFVKKFMGSMPRNCTKKTAKQYVDTWLCPPDSTVAELKALILSGLPGLPQPAIELIWAQLFSPSATDEGACWNA